MKNLKLKAIFISLCLITAIMFSGIVWWKLNPTSSYINQTGLILEKTVDNQWQLTSVREILHPKFKMDWNIKIVVLRPELSFFCQKDGTTEIHAEEGTVSKTTLGSWANECLDSEPPVSFTITRQAYAFYNLIPLAPSTYTITTKVSEIVPNDKI